MTGRASRSVPPRTLGTRLRERYQALTRLDGPLDDVTRIQWEAFQVTLAIMGLAALGFAPALLLLDDKVGACLALAVLPSIPVALAVLRLTGNLSVAWHLIGTLDFVILAAFSLHEGGITAPALWWMILVPAGQIACGRNRAAVFWIVVDGAFVLTLVGLDLLGVRFEQNLSRYPSILTALTLVGLFGAMLSFLFFMERSRRSSMAKLRGLNQELGEARDAALVAVRAKATFLANMSHEIRTPLNGVLGTAEVLRDSGLTDKQRQLLDTMMSSGRGLVDLLTDVVDLSSLEDGAAVVTPETFDIGELVESMAESLAPQARAKRLTLDCRVAPEVPEAVIGDPRQVRRIVFHLLCNAIKFTDAGRVFVQLAREGDGTDSSHCRLSLRVQDTGVGIDAETVSRLFAPFTQVDSSTTRESGGSGIGLALCRSLAALMGGEVSVRSTPGQGSTFVFSASYTIPASSPESRQATQLAHPDDHPLVLLVEAESDVAAVMEEACTRSGARALRFTAVDSVLSPNVALEGVRAVIVDESVLERRGAEWLLAVLRRFGLAPAAGAVVVTGPETASRTTVLPDGLVTLFRPLRRAQIAAFIASSATARGVDVSVSDGASLVGTRVLVAEDNPVNRKVAASLLERLGCTVDLADDGAEAVSAYRQRRYDIVFMDCQMPIMDGLDATRCIRNLEAAEVGRSPSRTPIVAVTANVSAEDRASCLAAGMDDHLPKPVTLAMFAGALSRWVQGTRPAIPS